MTPRHRDALAEELRWYWASATGAMGLRSNFAAMMAGIHGCATGGGTPATDIDERCVEAATRDRRVRRALAQVPDHEAIVLVHAFGPGIRELPAFGLATGVVPLTRVARQAWVKSGTNRTLEGWLARLLVRVHTGRGEDPDRDAELLKAIRLDAERMLHGALQAYAAKRHPGRPDVPGGAKDRDGRRAA
jgi:hypothetical protein